MSSLYVGTAGWTIPRVAADLFPAEGPQLARYAARFSAVEINSSFHQPHRRATYARWAATVPASFRFAVKLPKEISHARRLHDADDALARFLDEAGGLGDRLGPLLLQLPPSLTFDAPVAGRFFARMRRDVAGAIVCEPRHASWFDAEAERLLQDYEIARVAADPAKVPKAAEPGGWRGLLYLRLHGSPVVYRSSYDEVALDRFAALLRAATGPCWCIFDNTTFGASALNADALARRAW